MKLSAENSRGRRIAEGSMVLPAGTSVSWRMIAESGQERILLDIEGCRSEFIGLCPFATELRAALSSPNPAGVSFARMDRVLVEDYKATIALGVDSQQGWIVTLIL